MAVRTTPEKVTSLKDDEVFVFGSNLAGRHGKGAALLAKKWGAVTGSGAGRQGQTYAIATKDFLVRNSLPLTEIARSVRIFIDHAANDEEHTFLVTEIGCGLAGYDPKDIAPLFKGAIDVENIHLPERFWQNLGINMEDGKILSNE